MHFCMNWDALSFDWNQIRAFLATAEEGSFSGAARALRSTQPTVGRQVAALEESLGLVLVERSGRGLTLTQPGRDLLEQVRKMGEAAVKISLVADGQTNALSGKVTIFGHRFALSRTLARTPRAAARESPGYHAQHCPVQ